MSYHVDCADCDFEIAQPTAELAALVRDLHHLYNGHKVDWGEQ